jgi:hypothetical protein
MPEGFLTEAGPRPDFAEMFGAVELPGGGYRERTQANVRDSDATIWFGDPESPGGRTTLRACTGFRKPVYLVIEGLTQPADVVAGIEPVSRRNAAPNPGHEPGRFGSLASTPFRRETPDSTQATVRSDTPGRRPPFRRETPWRRACPARSSRS